MDVGGQWQGLLTSISQSVTATKRGYASSHTCVCVTGLTGGKQRQAEMDSKVSTTKMDRQNIADC
jgi:hypothetical protein